MLDKIDITCRQLKRLQKQITSLDNQNWWWISRNKINYQDCQPKKTKNKFYSGHIIINLILLIKSYKNVTQIFKESRQWNGLVYKKRLTN